MITLVGRILRFVYRRFPLGESTKQGLKSRLYRLAGPWLQGSASYRHWMDEQSRSVSAPEQGAPLQEIVPPDLIPQVETGLIEAAAALQFASPTRPEVSIIIPVHNQVSFTLCCLQSIAAHPPRASFEIILIDDASTDQTSEVVAAIRGVRIIRQEVNRGFLMSVNRAAGVARGRYLHLLNNDTQVQEGWLDALLTVFDECPNAGLVGSKLVYPSGHLQEAGAALRRDGSVDLIGLNADPMAPEYNQRRLVDHCSGASILIEKTLFDALGGLDEVYAPAYYEDCDLSLKVAASGREIVYEPTSVVVHHLSISTDREPGAKLARIGSNCAIYRARWQARLDQIDQIRLIAFYLPQYHPIPENDQWWGKGFTEWTNVTRARPNFVGHEQPHLPADLGFYDLRLAETRQAQAELAHRYGIYGFCYYFYWFSGKRLLHRPLDEVLDSGEPDFPFCICWANESWSRRWDGRDTDILMAQEHSAADDLALIQYLESVLKDRRYIRIHGRPLILVYRIELLDDAARTADTWRQYCRDVGIGEIFLASVQSFGTTEDPRERGFDAAVEFPPHGIAVSREPRPKLDNPDFVGQIYDYVATAERFMQRPLPGYPLFRAAMPGWDNTARRQDASNIFLGSSPEAYERWLRHVVEQSRWLNPPGERIVFVNAWNEWAEGNHLEPDQRYGHAYLRATRRALGDWAPPECIALDDAREIAQGDHR